jgi:nucleoside-diphosphate-sugar epimerase
MKEGRGSPEGREQRGRTAPAGSPVLVTGGTGFLGRRLVERLLAGGRAVTVLARREAPDLTARGVRFIRAPLADPVAVEAACAGMATVFHVAAKVGVWGDPAEFFAANVLGTRAVIAGCRAHRVARLIHTSTPSVVYNGRDLSGADESWPLTTRCPSPYPLTKAQAEREVLAANGTDLRTVALRPHLIWGVGDPHLIPRVLARARAGKLRIVGDGHNRVDLVHIDNAVDAHLAAEAALGGAGTAPGPAAGRAYFITNGEPVRLWDWINDLLTALGERAVTRRIPRAAAYAAGAAAEAAWRILRRPGEPPMTRFVANELAKDHWFDLTAARRDLGYRPRVTMADGMAGLVAALIAARPSPAAGPPRTAR